MTESRTGSRGIVARIVHVVREARRRKVWVTVAAYTAIGIALIEISGAVSEALLFPSWTDRLVTFLLILGFPVVLVIAWIFDFEGGELKRTASLAELERSGAGGRAGIPADHALRDAPPIPEAVPRRRRSAPTSAPTEPIEVDDDRLKRAALGHVRHELRTPINAILGYSEMLLEDEEDAGVREDLTRIHSSGRRLLGLIEELLDPDRLAGPIDRDIESYAAQIEADLRTPVNAVVGYGEMLLEEERERGRTALVPDLERIVTAARTLLETSGDIVRVATSAPEVKGVGAGDRVRESSELTREVLARLGAADHAAERVEGQGTLLVVDDNATNRDLLTRQLARYGYVVDTAEDGEAALERLRERDFDLVLLDVIMPRMDGVETLRRIQADERLRDVPVVMLSSLDEVEGAVACIEAGAEEFLTRPVHPALLEARIASHLELRSLRSREAAYRRRIDADARTIDRLLHSAFPPEVAARIRSGDTRVVVEVPVAAVLHCAVDPSTSRSGERLAERVARLSDLFAEFDDAARTLGIPIVLGGRTGFTAAVPKGAGEDGSGGIGAIGALALRMRSAHGGPDGADRDGTSGLRLRFGVHAGPVVSAVLGRDRPRFDLWGDAVDTAVRLAQAADPGAIVVSPSARAELADRFSLVPGRVVDVPGLGQMRPHLLTDEVPIDARHP